MAVKTGRAVPPRMLEEPPEVRPGLGLYVRAFFDLAADRQGGGGRIPWTAVQAWCESKDLVGVDAQDVHFLVGRMDTWYIDWVNRKSKRQAEERTQKNGDARGVLGKDG